ncbi:MAG: OmpA family protein [Flavobacteriales bacterium]|jgi:chemotaxis protein MotB|nr:OmpA family protein [Flavobacteriales bacterium]
MKYPIILSLGLIVLFGSCVPKKKHMLLQASNANLIDKADALQRQLDECNAGRAAVEAQAANLQTANAHLTDRVNEMSVTNQALLNSMGNMATLSAQEAVNLEKSLERIKEKDLQIRRLQDAKDKQDSITLALVVSLKSSLGNLNDTDVVVNVEKSVVFISLSDKMLFKSGSTEISSNAKNVLAKVATVVNDKPEMEVLVEGHTDNVPIRRDCIKDNWDLSVLRATSITRVLTQELGVDAGRVTAGGRAEFVPLAPNDTAENKSKNRRTRIVIMPKLDEFYKMVEDGLKQAEQLD